MPHRNKNLVIISLALSIITLIFCAYMTLSQNNNDQIEKSKKDAIESINKTRDDCIQNAEKEISSLITAAIGKADSSMEEKMKIIEGSINQKSDNAIKDVEDKVKNINRKYHLACLIGISAILIGLLALFYSIKSGKKPTISPHGLERMINEILNNPRLSTAIDSRLKLNLPTIISSVDKTVNGYVSSSRFEEELTKLVKQVLQNEKNAKNNELKDSDVYSRPRHNHTLYFRSSDSRILGDSAQEYQIGKSVYKLLLESPESTSGVLTLCNDFNDACERIIKYDNNYLEPVCNITSKTSQASKVIVRAVGRAEKRDSTWTVIQTIEVVFE